MSKYLNSYLIEQLLSLDEAELTQFIKDLKPETQKYLDTILEKAERDPMRLKRFLDLK